VTCYLREDRDEVGLVPFWGHDHPGGAVQVLFEAQLEGLAHGADDALGEALTALQDVAGSLVDGILGYIGHIIRHVRIAA